MQGLFRAIRAACSRHNWSQGVELVRREAVVGQSADEDEVVLRVKAPGKAVAPTVVLYPQDLEWDCDCPSKEETCSHVAAAIIALTQAREAGQELPAGGAETGGRVRYRLRGDGDKLRLGRVIVGADQGETPLRGSLTSLVAGRGAGPAVVASQADLAVDQLLGSPPSELVPLERLGELCAAFDADADVWLGDERVRLAADPVAPRVSVRDRGPDLELVVEASPEVTAVPAPGLARCGELVRPLAEIWLTGPRLESLPYRKRFRPEQVGELVGEVLPALRARVPVTIATARLPGIERSEPPRLHFETRQEGNRLELLPLIVYGDPPHARIDGERLVHLGGPVPVRDRDAERRLVHRLRDEWNMVPGHRVAFEGDEALRMATRLRRSEAPAARAHRTLDAALVPRVEVRGDELDVRFEVSDGERARQADPAEVVRAWREGFELAPLDGGGWAPLPLAWLAQHGHRVADLLAARDERGQLPAHALPTLARLCDDLDQPRPPGFARLAPLLEGFAGLPSAPLPDDLTAELRPYQRQGVDWLGFLRQAGLGGVLADDMGLGKTLQALCVVRGRTLIVCPTSLVHNWAAEARRFRPGLRVSIYHGPTRRLDPDADLTLTTYALLRLDADALQAIAWDAVILDEAQAIKNPDSQVARAAYALRATSRLTLTGTPVENRLDELWSQLHFTNPGLLGGRGDFDARYARPIADGDAGAAAMLRERVRPFVLRRLKREVAPELPPRTDAVLPVELDERERAVYDTVRAAAQKDVLARLEQGGSVLAALEALLRLRQAACHAALVPGQEASGSSKIELLRDQLTDAVADEHKALVFSQWTSLLDLVEPHLTEADIPFVRLDGATRDRGAVVEAFQAADGPPVMLVSLKAGGTGLNLTAADHVFLLDPWWNPAVEEQAADRAHRIGQDKPVFVYRMVAKDTVEERILALQERKRALADAALGEADAAAALTRDDLLALLA